MNQGQPESARNKQFGVMCKDHLKIFPDLGNSDAPPFMLMASTCKCQICGIDPSGNDALAFIEYEDDNLNVGAICASCAEGFPKLDISVLPFAPSEAKNAIVNAVLASRRG
jgi:hypothetical protein